jgi:subtilisin family serine protease
MAAHSAGDVSTTADFAARHGVTLIEGLVRVVVVGDGEADQSALAQQIAALGGQVETAYDRWTQARLPVEALPSLADAPGVRFVRRPWLPLPATTSEGVAVTHADEWLEAGLTGEGVKVGVLDPGFLGYNIRVSEGELPSDVITKSFVGSGSEIDFWGGTSHGTACAEIVHDMAPDAQLYLVNSVTEVEWANAVDWLLAQDVDAISFSAGWPVGGPGDGTGTLAGKVDDVRDAGVLWVNAAGNSAQQHWMGQWNDPESNGWHNYTSTDETNELTVSGESKIIIGLRWNDPWGGSANDYDLFLYQEKDGSLTLVQSSTNVQDGDDEPQEFIAFYLPSPGVYHVAVSKQSGAQIRMLELFSYDHDFHYHTATSSLHVPADSAGSLTVGATYWQNDALEEFSSEGPTRDGRIKPDLAAPDGVSVRTEAWRDSGFYGTSASAPHVAGAAALVLEALPTLTPAQIQNWLEDRAVDLGTMGKDNAFGAGRLNLHMAVMPGAALQGSTVTLAVSGIPFASTATFYLSRPGYDDILPTDVTWVSLSQLRGTVDLSGAALGFWSAVVRNTPSISITLPDAFLVASDELYLPVVMRKGPRPEPETEESCPTTTPPWPICAPACAPLCTSESGSNFTAPRI